MNYSVVTLKYPALIIMEGIPSDDPGMIGEYIALKGAPIARNPFDAQTALQSACNNHPGRYFFIAVCTMGLMSSQENPGSGPD